MAVTANVLMAQDRPLFENESFAVYPGKVEWGDYHATVLADNALASTYEGRNWLQHKSVPNFATFKCGVPISNVLYNMAVEELHNLIENDSTWRTGKYWGGVWTRDISYSSLLAAAYMEPEVTRVSLMKKVRNGRILQDTGTGGSWPVSTDRAVWALAAWQYYLVTGDKEWLRQSYAIISATLQQDEAVVYDRETGLVRGESSFLDWREESYPRWMEPADIAMSECLGTNALFFRANQIASRMALLLDDKEGVVAFESRANSIKDAINNYLWLDDKGYYGQYRYGRAYPVVSPRSETLGEALCVLFDIADEARAHRIVQSVRLTPYGTPCFDPQIPNIYPYHNNAVWPFVQAYWMWAAAEVGNQRAVEHSMACIYRAAAIYATNHENFVATDGALSTQMNSPNMLWSIAGNISIAHRVLMGIHFQENGLAIRPFVPRGWEAPKRMTMNYRKAQLEIVVEGYGDRVIDTYLDGKKQKSPFVSASLKGKHRVRVVMSDSFENPEGVTTGPVVTSLETTPKVYLDDPTTLAWRQVVGAKEYKIVRNGVLLATVPEKLENGNRYKIDRPDSYAEYQVIAVDEDGVEGFASEPLACYDSEREHWYDMAEYAQPTQMAACKGFTGKGVVEVAVGVNNHVVMDLDVPEAGVYRVDFRYANGSDNLINNNQCAVRTLWKDDGGSSARLGTVVMPQRGKDLWNLWGMSSGIAVHLHKGHNKLVMSYEAANENMNAQGVNRAMIDAVRLVKMER